MLNFLIRRLLHHHNQYDKMWLPEELERIYKIAYKNISDQKIEDVLPPDDIKAIRQTGTAIANIGN